MRIEFVVATIFTVVGLIAAVFPRQFSDFMIAGNYAISQSRGVDASSAQRPWMVRVLGICFVTFSIFVAVVAGRSMPQRQSGATGLWEVIGPLTIAGVIALAGVAILLFRRSLAAIVARRVRENGGELYCMSGVDRFGHVMVIVVATWFLVIASSAALLGVHFLLTG